MSANSPEQNKKRVLEAFEVLFNRRDYLISSNASQPVHRSRRSSGTQSMRPSRVCAASIQTVHPIQ
jgi:hypothetical protein